jgi:hypothetical protein
MDIGKKSNIFTMVIGKNSHIFTVVIGKKSHIFTRVKRKYPILDLYACINIKYLIYFYYDLIGHHQ